MQLHARKRDVHEATHVRERHVPSVTHSRQGERCTCSYTLTPGEDVHAAAHSRQGDGCTCSYTLTPGRVCAELHAGQGEGCTEMHQSWRGVYRTTHSRRGLGCTELHNPHHVKRHRRAACTITSRTGMYGATQPAARKETQKSCMHTHVRERDVRSYTTRST